MIVRLCIQNLDIQIFKFWKFVFLWNTPLELTRGRRSHKAPSKYVMGSTTAKSYRFGFTADFLCYLDCSPRTAAKSEDVVGTGYRSGLST